MGSEKKEITFTGCKHLDFTDHFAAKKGPIYVGGQTKICWDRGNIDDTRPSLVQFCKLRGRLNHPEMCLCEETKQCGDFSDGEHKVKF